MARGVLILANVCFNSNLDEIGTARSDQAATICGTRTTGNGAEFVAILPQHFTQQPTGVHGHARP